MGPEKDPNVSFNRADHGAGEDARACTQDPPATLPAQAEAAVAGLGHKGSCGPNYTVGRKYVATSKTI